MDDQGLNVQTIVTMPLGLARGRCSTILNGVGSVGKMSLVKVLLASSHSGS